MLAILNAVIIIGFYVCILQIGVLHFRCCASCVSMSAKLYFYNYIYIYIGHSIIRSFDHSIVCNYHEKEISISSILINILRINIIKISYSDIYETPYTQQCDY